VADKTNATQAELEELNGLLVRDLIDKIKEGTASGADRATASKLIISNRIRPTDPEAEAIEAARIVDPADYPIQFPFED